MANNIDLTICAPEPSFRRFRCFGWLIWSRSPTGASAPKHSCSRFASLTLRTPHRSPVSLCFSGRLIFRLRTKPALRAAPVFRMAYSAIPHHRPYGRWCFARLIRQAETLELQPHSRPPSKHTALSRNAHASAASRPPNPAPSSRFFSISRRSGLRGCRHRVESTHHLTPSGCVPSGGAGAPPAPPLPPPSRCRPDRFKGSPLGELARSA